MSIFFFSPQLFYSTNILSGLITLSFPSTVLKFQFGIPGDIECKYVFAKITLIQMFFAILWNQFILVDSNYNNPCYIQHLQLDVTITQCDADKNHYTDDCYLLILKLFILDVLRITVHLEIVRRKMFKQIESVFVVIVFNTGFSDHQIYSIMA
ncbi:hypothetical protein ACTA71_007550 [Dictyostelium dimigraforme]